LLLKALNKQRKQQAKKIDILCNDFIAAQRQFIQQLSVISFAAQFYEAILGAMDLSALLCEATKQIRGEALDEAVTFFLRDADDFELHIFEPTSKGQELPHLENHFSPELMDNICQANKVCTLPEMLGMGLEASPAGLGKISAMTVPLGLVGGSVGFILLYRPASRPFSALETARLCAVTGGLSRAIRACQSLLRSAE